MNLTLYVWRQKGPKEKGRLVHYEAKDISADMSFLEMLDTVNQELEKAGRVADFLEFSELMAQDALHRNESCGGHFRVEYEMPDGEAKRDDEHFCYAAAWEYKGAGKAPELHKEPLSFESVKLAVRSYK